jgi:hypothetical protein
MAPRDVPPQLESQPNSPQYIPQEEDPFEIVVMVPIWEEAQEATEESQQLPQNNGNNDNDNDHEEEEEDHEAKQEEGNDDEDKDVEDYTPVSNSKKEKMYCNTNEIKTTGNEALIPTGRLRDLVNRIDIPTSSLESREFRALDEKSTRRSWRSSTGLVWSAGTRVQLLEPLTRMK